MSQVMGESQLRSWLAELAAGYLEIPAERLETDVLLADYGLDSVYALTLLDAIEEKLDLKLDDTVIWDYSTIDALAAYLAKELEQR
jgi:acyl carrier protein